MRVERLQPVGGERELVIALGPVASQVAIKQLGTNGGGFFNANSAHPLENPTPLAGFLEAVAILLVPAALCHTFGVMVGDPRQGRAVLAATAAAIAAEAGVDDVLAEATPEAKLALIRELQARGHLVAMAGDGTNDAPALAQADVAVAMNSGTQAAREAGNMVDLDSNPTKLLEIVEIGKQLLMTRGALTTFSIANDLAKYFAIIPAAFVGTYPSLQALDVMRLATPESAILSAVIFNALVIVALVPLALSGVRYRAVGAAALLRRHLLIYGLGGLVAPFVGIKAIDLVLVALGLA